MTDTPSGKPREWNVYLDHDGSIIGKYSYDHKPTTMVTKEAYDQLASELAEAKAEIERLKLHIPTMSDDEAEYRAHNWQKVAYQEREQVNKFWQIISIYEKALNFYADGNNWREQDPKNRPAGMTYKHRITSRDSIRIGPGKYDFGGGKNAKEALAEAEKALTGSLWVFYD